MFNFPNTQKPNFSNNRNFDYDTYWHARGKALNQKLKDRELIILDLISTQHRVLDIGCGNSLLPVKIKEKGIDIEVADISEAIIKCFSDYQITSYLIDLDRPTEKPLTKNYDVIILSEVLEHLKNPEVAISALKDSTKYFIITIPNSAFYRYRWHLLITGRFFKQWVYHPSEHLRFWSHIDFLDWLKAMELDLIDFYPANGFSLLGLWPKLKTGGPIYGLIR